jgi:hypothetical protein
MSSVGVAAELGEVVAIFKVAVDIGFVSLHPANRSNNMSEIQGCTFKLFRISSFHQNQQGL